MTPDSSKYLMRSYPNSLHIQWMVFRTWLMVMYFVQFVDFFQNTLTMVSCLVPGIFEIMLTIWAHIVINFLLKCGCHIGFLFHSGLGFFGGRK